MKRLTFSVGLSSLVALAACEAATVDARTIAQWGRACGVENLKVATMLSQKIFYLDEPGGLDPQLKLPPLNAVELARQREIEKALPCLHAKADSSDVQIQYALARPII